MFLRPYYKFFQTQLNNIYIKNAEIFDSKLRILLDTTEIVSAEIVDAKYSIFTLKFYPCCVFVIIIFFFSPQIAAFVIQHLCFYLRLKHPWSIIAAALRCLSAFLVEFS